MSSTRSAGLSDWAYEKASSTLAMTISSTHVHDSTAQWSDGFKPNRATRLASHKKQGPVAWEQPGLVCGSWLTEGRDFSAATRSNRSTDPVRYVSRRGAWSREQELGYLTPCSPLACSAAC